MNYTQPKRKRLSKNERKAVYEKCRGHCAYCGTCIELQNMQVDHLIPMNLHEAYAAQGIDIDTIDNMLPACRSCNNYKHSLSLEGFRRSIEHFTTVLMRNSVTYRNAVRFGQIIENPHEVIFFFESENTPNQH